MNEAWAKSELPLKEFTKGVIKELELTKRQQETVLELLDFVMLVGADFGEAEALDRFITLLPMEINSWNGLS